MSLKYNTFRSQRYLRSRFVEGRYLLASEGTDLELEVLDLMRKVVIDSLGENIAMSNGWKVERIDANKLLIYYGEGWHKGFPFSFRNGKDTLVVDSSLPGTTITDDSLGRGKILTISSLPSNAEYRLVIAAEEEAITETEDLFLRNINIPEATAQKVRLKYKVYVVPEVNQTETPNPYTTDDSTDKNYVNRVIITPSLGIGDATIDSSAQPEQSYSGVDYKLVLNSPSGGPLPHTSGHVSSLVHGTLIDSDGNSFHIYTGFYSGGVLELSLDREAGQLAPVISIGRPYQLIKREPVGYTISDSSSSLNGKLYWPIAKFYWDSSSVIENETSITDLRNVVETQEDFQKTINTKTNLIPVNGGNISFISNGSLTWTSDIHLMNPFTPVQTISAGTSLLIEDGFLVYDLDLVSGGTISRGNLNFSPTGYSGGVLNLPNLSDLSLIRLGNIIKNATGQISYITRIDQEHFNIQVSTGIADATAITIYLDSFASEYSNLDSNKYTLAARKSNKVYIGGGSLELEIGETSQIGDGISQALLTYLGAADENDPDPNYTSTYIVTQGSPLPTAISELDAELNTVENALAEPIYDEHKNLDIGAYPTGLAALTSINLPNNSRNGGATQTYVAAEGLLEIYINSLFKFQGVDWNPITNNSISFNYDLPVDTEIHFRIDAISGGSLGGGGGTNTLQDVYNNGRNIVTTTGNPVEISGPVGQKLLKVNGDIDITGVIDPKGISLTPQNTNPLGANQGIWVNLSNELIYENSTTSKNLTQAIENLESGLGSSALTRIMFNGTLLVIPKGTPVYSPSPGYIALANGSSLSTSRVIGVTTENISPSTNGTIAIIGVISGISGYTHNTLIYLGDDSGEMLDTEPTFPTFPSGFVVFIIGVMEGTNLIVRPQYVGVL